jgi:hypothetical protein
MKIMWTYSIPLIENRSFSVSNVIAARREQERDYCGRVRREIADNKHALFSLGGAPELLLAVWFVGSHCPQVHGVSFFYITPYTAIVTMCTAFFKVR